MEASGVEMVMFLLLLLETPSIAGQQESRTLPFFAEVRNQILEWKA